MSTDSTLYDASAYTDAELVRMLEFSTDSLNASGNIKLHSVNGTAASATERATQMIAKYTAIANDTTISSDKRSEAALIKTFFENVKTRFNSASTMPVLPVDEPVVDISTSAISQYGTPIQHFNTTDKENMDNMIRGGLLNPLPINTITRVISIDSRFRDTYNYPRSTDFTCTLTETLRNVLSLQLYFYHIPYTWYTVGSTYGNNFIYLISTTPGLDIYNYAIKISIDSGKYTAVQLCQTINTSIYNLANDSLPEFADIYFNDASTSAESGTTTNGTTITGTFLQYSSVSTMVKWWISMNQQYNESSFFVSFPGTARTAIQGIASNLGELFGMDFITPTSSVRNIDARTIRSTAMIENTSEIFNITADNSYITIKYNYNFDTSSNLPLTTVDFLTLNLIGQSCGGSSIVAADSSYTQAQLYTALTNAISANKAASLTDSTKKLSFASGLAKNTNTTTETFIYELTLELNRKNPSTHISHPDYAGAYITVVFSGSGIWTGASSCFKFVQTSTKIKDIISVSPKAYLIYTLPAKSSLYFRCTNSYWKSTALTIANDFNIPIGDGTTDESCADIISLATKINTKISAFNSVVQSTRSIPTSISAVIDIGLSQTALTAIPALTVNILRRDVVRATNGFKVELINEYNTTNLGSNIWSIFSGITSSTDTTAFSLFYSNLSYNTDNATKIYTFNVSRGSINVSSSAFISRNLFSIAYLGTDIPGLVGRTFVVSGGTPSNSSVSTYLNYGNPDTGLLPVLKDYIASTTNPLIITETTSLNNSTTNFAYSGCSISAAITYTDTDTDTDTITVTLTITMSASLKAKDYSIYFLENRESIPTDLDTPTSTSNLTNNVWNNYFNFPNWTNLYTATTLDNTNIKKMIASGSVSVAMVYLTLDDLYFYVRVSNDALGLYTYTSSSANPSIYFNDYKVAFSPKKVSSVAVNTHWYLYTHASIISAINSAFASIKDLQNSTITINTVGRDVSLHRTILSLSVSKTFTQANYSAVFYSAKYFSSCASANDSSPYLNTGTSRYSTLGWILGFQSNAELEISASASTYIQADTPLNTNINNYLTLVLTDYVQSSIATHGMVSILPPEYSVVRPSYTRYTSLLSSSENQDESTCNFNNAEFRSAFPTNPVLTNLGIFSANQVKIATTDNFTTRISEAYSKDAFAVIPVDTSTNPNVFMDYSQSLQSQERVYFGPVNLSRFSVQLRTSAGDLLDLNNANWGFAMLAKIAYT